MKVCFYICGILVSISSKFDLSFLQLNLQVTSCKKKNNQTKIECKIFLDVCANAKIVNGVGYQRHNSDCDKFFQCYQGEKMQDRMAVPRQCPFGQFWDQNVPTCRTASEVKCDTGQLDTFKFYDRENIFEKKRESYQMFEI